MRYTREFAFARATRLLRKPKRASGPFGNPDRGLSPLDPKESALLYLYHVVPRYGLCSVVCMCSLAFLQACVTVHNLLMLFIPNPNDYLRYQHACWALSLQR